MLQRPQLRPSQKERIRQLHSFSGWSIEHISRAYDITPDAVRRVLGIKTEKTFSIGGRRSITSDAFMAALGIKEFKI
jgi:hypothetical protein